MRVAALIIFVLVLTATLMWLPKGTSIKKVEKPWWLPGERYVEPEPDETEEG